VEYGLLALLVWTPLPIASVEEWSILVIEIAALVLFGATLWMDRPPQVNVLHARRLRGLRFVILALLVFIVLQIVPLPRSILAVISPRTLSLRAAYVPAAAPPMRSLSLLPGRTVFAGLELAAYFLIGAVVVKTVTRRQQFRRLMLVLVAMGVFEAFYGLFELMRRNPRLLFY
jgi:hypothetical protein